jgi:hypothetical protein
MATNQNLIDIAAGKLGVVEAGDSCNATDSATMLGVLNRMMHEWKFRSMDFNWFTQDTLGDTAPIPAWAEEGVIANLAVRAATDFRVKVSAELASESMVGKQTIATTLISQTLDNADMSHLPLGQGRLNRNSIETDS